MFNILILENENKYKPCINDALVKTCKLNFSSSGNGARKILQDESYDVVILNLCKNRKQPFDLLSWIVSEFPFTPVIAVSETAETDFVVQAVKNGAFDFIPMPFSNTRLLHSVKQALENLSLKNERDYLRRNQDIIYDFDKIISETLEMRDVINNLKKFSQTDSTILMTGETGTGKSFLSGTIHFNSLRRNKPFININCANICETLLESELFGHEKGAFTGADKLRIGRFEQAKGGTVFLDEIGEMSLTLQGKLLKVLEHNCFERVGGNRTIHSDLRFIAATNRNMKDCIKQGSFKEDLYFRLKVLSVNLPPLRKRRPCIEPLSFWLLENLARSLKKRVTGFSPQVMKWIHSYSWPGNLRELSNSIERAVILEDRNVIQKKHFPMTEDDDECVGLIEEKQMIINALEEKLWVQKDAAKVLGMTPRNLNYRIRKYGITHSRWRKNR